jgi:LysM repeat protein
MNPDEGLLELENEQGAELELQQFLQQMQAQQRPPQPSPQMQPPQAQMQGGLGQMRPPQTRPQQMRPPQARPPQMQQQMIAANTVPYQVVRGDSFTKIARDNGVDVQTLIRINPGIKNPDRIFPGQEIRLPIPREIMNMEQRVPQEHPSQMMQRFGATPEADPSRYSHQAFEPDGQEMLRQALMGMGAAALPMAAAAGPAGAASGLGALARAMPNMLNPAGRVAMPASKGAVNWPGATPAMGNVRPLEGGLGAMRATARGMMNQQAQRANIGPRGMSGVPFNSARPILPQGAQPPAGGLTLEQLLASMR